MNFNYPIILEKIDEAYSHGLHSDMKVIVHKESGYVNGAKLCTLFGRHRMKHFNESVAYKHRLEIIQTKLESTEHNEQFRPKLINGKLIIKFEETKSSLKIARGTYLHPACVHILLDWIEVKMKRKDQSSEKIAQQTLHLELGGKIEVPTSLGYIDLLTETEIIEIKKCKLYKAAIGQVLCYSLEYPDHTKRVHLFDTRSNESFDIVPIQRCCDYYGIKLTTD